MRQGWLRKLPQGIPPIRWLVGWALLFISTDAAVAQPPVIELDFTSNQLQRETVFRDRGLCFDVELEFGLLSRDQVTIQAKLPDKGAFEIQLLSDSPLQELRRLSSAEAPRYEIALKIKPQSMDDLKQKAQKQIDAQLSEHRKEANRESEKLKPEDLAAYLRENELTIPKDDSEQKQEWRTAYAKDRTIVLGEKEVREMLDELAAKRAKWLDPEVTAKWPEASPREVARSLLELLTYDLAVEYLEELDLEIETTRQNFVNLVTAKVKGVHVVLTGNTGSDDGTAASARMLNTTDAARLRKAVMVKAICTYCLEADERDPNSRWFQGQRVTCRGRGIAAIRVEGQLTPRDNDRVDWWTLYDYDPGSVRARFPTGDGIRYELYPGTGTPTYLRVVATGPDAKPYALEFQPRTGTGGQRVVIQETSSQLDVKFPY